MKHCCRNMEYYSSQKNSLLEYSPETRTYDLFVYENYPEKRMRQSIEFCPWCGKKLPKGLSCEWTEMVEKEMGINDIWDLEWSDIPDKFKTDEWWKKRGL